MEVDHFPWKLFDSHVFCLGKIRVSIVMMLLGNAHMKSLIYPGHVRVCFNNFVESRSSTTFYLMRTYRFVPYNEIFTKRFAYMPLTNRDANSRQDLGWPHFLLQQGAPAEKN